MKKAGIVRLTDDLEMKDFTWEISALRINPDTKEITVEVRMWEVHSRHRRDFDITPNVGTALYNKATDILEICKQRLLNKPMFEGSTEA